MSTESWYKFENFDFNAWIICLSNWFWTKLICNLAKFTAPLVKWILNQIWKIWFQCWWNELDNLPVTLILSQIHLQFCHIHCTTCQMNLDTSMKNLISRQIKWIGWSVCHTDTKQIYLPSCLKHCTTCQMNFEKNL